MKTKKINWRDVWFTIIVSFCLLILSEGIIRFIVCSNWDNGIMQEYSGEFTVTDEVLGGRHYNYTVRVNNGHLLRAPRLYKAKVDGIRLLDCTELRFKYMKIKLPSGFFVYNELVSITTVDGQTVFLSEKAARSNMLGVAILETILLALLLFLISIPHILNIGIKTKNMRNKRRKKKLKNHLKHNIEKG